MGRLADRGGLRTVSLVAMGGGGNGIGGDMSSNGLPLKAYEYISVRGFHPVRVERVERFRSKVLYYFLDENGKTYGVGYWRRKMGSQSKTTPGWLWFFTGNSLASDKAMWKESERRETISKIE